MDPLLDVALHQCLPLSSVCCFPIPGGSLLLCYVILPSSAWSSSRPLPSPWLPLCASLCPPIVLSSVAIYIWLAHFHFCFSVYSMISMIFVLFLISEHGILSFSFRSNIFLSIALWAVLSLSFVYLETMFGSHRSWLARYIGPISYLFCKWNGELFILEISLFFPKQLHAALILAYISSLVVSLRCMVCPGYLNSVTFSIFYWSISMSSLSAWFVMYFVFPLCIFKPTFRLSEFKLFRCFSICFVVSLKRANCAKYTFMMSSLHVFCGKKKNKTKQLTTWRGLVVRGVD